MPITTTTVHKCDRCGKRIVDQTPTSWGQIKTKDLLIENEILLILCPNCIGEINGVLMNARRDPGA